MPVFSYADKGQKWLIAQNNTKQQKEELSAYDPFADYSEFEDTVEEQESINFFQNGRFLTLGATGGVRLFTLNMNEFYNIGPVYGGYLDYFFNLKYSIQFGLKASTHNIALQTNTSSLRGAADFISMELAFKYFFDKSLFNKYFSWLQPYLFIGILHTTVTMVATATENPGYFKDKGYGANMGFGLEFHFLKKMHLGLQYEFQFVTLEQEASSLVVVTTGNQRQNYNYRPYGDWMNVSVILGVNF